MDSDARLQSSVQRGQGTVIVAREPDRVGGRFEQ